MDVSHLLEGLNAAQREAVTAPPGHLLVLAGAGSGKTRVLVHRIAWSIQVEGVGPWNILAVTFTNKAAREMRARIDHLVGHGSGPMWVGTFHGLAHRLLRAHWQDAGLPQGFQILDSDDQLRAIKRLMRELNIDEDRWPARQVQWFINAQKDEGLRPDHIDDGGDPFLRQMLLIYREYEASCQRSGVVDFAELLLRSHELWLNRPDILGHYRERFRHILVDEFQDTNAIQYAWIRMLAGIHNHLFVVGDDDQSIYGWRGAKVENLHHFQRDFPSTTLVRLEQNYRSTGNILEAANKVIAHNPNRLGKNLWTEGGDGEKIALYSAYNEMDEARFVADHIGTVRRQAVRSYSSFAILYRTSAQSRLFEEALSMAGVPFRVYGGQRFFERAEVKDALAYVRLAMNRHDDPGFERAVNNPPRGIGAKTLDAVRSHAREIAGSLWQAAESLVQEGRLPKRAATALKAFLELVDEAAERIDPSDVSVTVDTMIAASSLVEHHRASSDVRASDRIENLEELSNAARQFGYYFADGDVELSALEAFMAHAALDAAGDTAGTDHEDEVQLMTLHSAKGLEFPVVFITGVEEGLFPHSMSREDPERLAEERRLCYVGMTRAMSRLVLSHAESRRIHGSDTFPLPSRFLREIPSELMEELRPRPSISRVPAFSDKNSDQQGFFLGQRVSHPKFGDGIVLNAEGSGSAARVQVNFDAVGSKWLVVAYANLAPL